MAGCYCNVREKRGIPLLIAAPLVSVLTSCYNAAEFLPEAIESILKQTFKDFEFILIDDGSTDNTLDIISGYAAKDDRIVIIKKKNTGLADSLNIGIWKARGELIARMDADDISLPDRLEKQVAYFQKHRDVILLGSGCNEIDKEGRVVKQHHYPIGHRSLIRCFERDGSPFPHSSVIYKTEVVKRINGYRNRLNGAEDLDLWMRLSSLGKISCLNVPLVKLRKHEASITARSEKSIILSYGARVSHLLRNNGYLDPIEQDERLCEEFLSWIKERLVREHALRMNQFYLDLRNKLYCKDVNIFKRIIQLMVNFAVSSHKFKFLHQKILGSDLVFKLTNEWMEHSSIF